MRRSTQSENVEEVKCDSAKELLNELVKEYTVYNNLSDIEGTANIGYGMFSSMDIESLDNNVYCVSTDDVELQLNDRGYNLTPVSLNRVTATGENQYTNDKKEICFYVRNEFVDKIRAEYL